jgi:death on curing protein
MILTVSMVIAVHERLIETSGGERGIKDINLIDSAIGSIYQTFDGKELYPTVIEKAARLCFTLNKNHAFIDGNKRISMHMLALFLRFHEIIYTPSSVEVVRVGLSLANGSMTYEDLLNWLKKVID